MTLIEVLAALAVLGVLLVGVVMGQARWKRQSAMAIQRTEACRAADDLLAGWWEKPEQFPRNDSGQVRCDQRVCRWRTSVQDNRAVEELGGQVVRLELFAVPARSDERALATVDVVLPNQQDSP